MSTKIYTDTFGIFSLEVIDSNEEIGVVGKFGKTVFGLTNYWSFILLAVTGIKIHEMNYFSNQLVILRANISNDDFEFDALSINDKNLDATVANILNIYNKTCMKATEAFVSGVDYYDISELEARILDLNKIVWTLKTKFNARCVIFPDSPSCHELVPIDPDTLRLNKIINNDKLYLKDVSFLGAYCCSTFNRELFETSDNPLVDIILRVDHDVSELMTRMPYLDAQSLWRGHKSISCQAELTSKKVAIVIGDIEFNEW